MLDNLNKALAHLPCKKTYDTVCTSLRLYDLWASCRKRTLNANGSWDGGSNIPEISTGSPIFLVQTVDIKCPHFLAELQRQQKYELRRVSKLFL